LDAADAIYFAEWAIDQAEYEVIDAVTARANADELAAARASSSDGNDGWQGYGCRAVGQVPGPRAFGWPVAESVLDAPLGHPDSAAGGLAQWSALTALPDLAI
jgi:hypothetical protein